MFYNQTTIGVIGLITIINFKQISVYTSVIQIVCIIYNVFISTLYRYKSIKKSQNFKKPIIKLK